MCRGPGGSRVQGEAGCRCPQPPPPPQETRADPPTKHMNRCSAQAHPLLRSRKIPPVGSVGVTASTPLLISHRREMAPGPGRATPAHGDRSPEFPSLSGMTVRKQACFPRPRCAAVPMFTERICGGIAAIMGVKAGDGEPVLSEPPRAACPGAAEAQPQVAGSGSKRTR